MYFTTNRFSKSAQILQSALEKPSIALRQWLDAIEVKNPQVARWLCQLIPAQCPFERDIQLFGRIRFHIPPLCKLNPVYEQLINLRWRALTFLADICREDISQYC